jgi:hypothetical protein
MIRRVLMWRASGKHTAERSAPRHRVMHAREGSCARGPGLRSREVGVDTSGVVDAFEAVLLIAFESQSARAVYARHPQHPGVRDAVDAMHISRRRGDSPATRHDRAAAA